jgi:2,4-dienoyl-CoA reductase-like NADH-dependent reductase (Old Yellow Enzyme family)
MPGLLTPLRFAGLDLRNRIVMPPMASGRADPDGRPTQANVAYHRVRASAGCGMVIVEHAFVAPRGRFSAGQIGAHDEGGVDALAVLADGIRAGGAVACLQLSHAGTMAGGLEPGARPVGPSAVAHPRNPDVLPDVLDAAGIAAVVEAFARAADRARRAGFDAVEVHAAHGFLLSQFLSPLTNRREDAYGGDLAGRSRLHAEVLRAVSATVGNGLAVFVRLGACDDMPGGLTLDEACAVAPALVAAGAQMVDVSGGLQGSRPPGREGQGYFQEWAAAIRAVVEVPVMTTGGIHEPAFADRLVRHGIADLVGVGRAMLTDPGWAARAIAELGGQG